MYRLCVADAENPVDTCYHHRSEYPPMPKRASARDLADPASRRYTIEQSPFFLLNRATATYALLMDRALSRVGADVPRWRVLVLAEQRGPISVSAIADLAVIRLSTVTKVVQRLTADGLLTVRRSKNDARVTVVGITLKGREIAGVVRATASRIFQQAFTDVSEPEIRTLNRLLLRVCHNMDGQGRH